MKILADENIDAPIVDLLRQSQHLVWYVAEMSPGINDDEVLRIANQQEAVLLTADKDFGELFYRQKRLATGIVLIRLAGLPPIEKAMIVDNAFEQHGKRMIGSFTVITSKTIRIRHSS
jgi:predicted nuclease of predicted toxin-antitoxin system